MKTAVFIKVWIGLIVLTILSAIASNSSDLSYAIALIISLSMLKFLGVSFYFMELRKAHFFWKFSILIYTCLFSIITILIL